MELKVWVEGLQRVICGVSDVTTCQDVVIALAQATGKTGRFTLIEKWRDSERLLSPSDNPFKILRKWGEYASDVQFVLCQSDKAGQCKSGKLLNHLIPPAAIRSGHSASNGNIKKALSFSGAHAYLGSSDSGHDQSKVNYENSLETLSEGTSSDSREGHARHTETPGERNKHHAQPNRPKHSASHLTTSLGHHAHLNGPTNDGYHSLERKPKANILEGRNNAFYRSLERRPKPAQRQHFDNRFQKNVPLEGVVLSSRTNDNPVGTRPPAPPSYEDLYGEDGRQPLKRKNGPKQNGDMEEYDLDLNLSVDSNGDQTVKVREQDDDKHREAYEDLLKLLQLQQEKMTMQESHMHHIDSDILFWEEKDQSETRELSLLKEQKRELDITCKHYENEINDTEFFIGMLSHEIESQKSLQSEVKSMQSKLSTCDSELSKSKDHLENLLRELEREKRELEERIKADEAKLSEELRDLKKRLDEAHGNSRQMDDSGGDLEENLSSLAELLAKKKSEATQLEQDLKEVNLVLFMSAPTDFTLESEDKTSKPPPRTGTSRKMTASPHILAETVPTVKHPHGLWV